MSCRPAAARDRRSSPDAGRHPRVPTRFVRKYTARAQLKPAGAPRAGLRSRETGGGGRPARFCQEQTHVLAEQFSSMTRVPCSVSVRQNTRSRISMDRAVDRAAQAPLPHRRLQRGAPAARRADEASSRAATAWSSAHTRGSVGRWVFGEVERNLTSERTPEGLARGHVLGAEARPPPKGRSLGVCRLEEDEISAS